jgi:hypothetical protein
MGETIKIRFPNDLWWTEIEYSSTLKWIGFEITYLSDKTCFVKIVDYNGNSSKMELYREDYTKIMNNKAFMLKFKLKKHIIND